MFPIYLKYPSLRNLWPAYQHGRRTLDILSDKETIYTLNGDSCFAINATSLIFKSIPFRREDTLHVVEQFGLRLYRTLLVAGIPVTPGDTLAVTIPGSIEFPGLTIRTRTAEVFTFVDPGAPVVGEPVNLTWRSPGAPGSTMVFFLRYANSIAPGGVPNEQIVCGFADDGSGTIDPSYLNGWQSAPPTSRAIAATRLRYNEIQVDSRTRVTIVSTFEIPTPPIIP